MEGRHGGCSGDGGCRIVDDQPGGDVEDLEDRRPRDDGTEPVHEQPPEAPGPARSGAQYLVVGIGVLMVVAALLWFLLPIAG